MIFILVLLFPALRVKFENFGPRVVRSGANAANSVHAFHVATSAVAPCFRYWMVVAGTGEGWMEKGKDEELDALAARADHNYHPSLLGSDRLPAGELTQ